MILIHILILILILIHHPLSTIHYLPSIPGEFTIQRPTINQLFSGSSRPLRAVSAAMSSKYSGNYPAEKCIDGVVSGGKSNLCHTSALKGEKTPWLALDFGGVVSVEKVVINNRDDCCGDRLRDAEIRVANQLPSPAQEMFRGGQLLGIFKGPAKNGEEVTLTSSTELRGRFVIVQINSKGNGIINLHEVTVWGKPA